LRSARKTGQEIRREGAEFWKFFGVRESGGDLRSGELAGANRFQRIASVKKTTKVPKEWTVSSNS
jgi:hypothetical protein